MPCRDGKSFRPGFEFLLPPYRARDEKVAGPVVSVARIVSSGQSAVCKVSLGGLVVRFPTGIYWGKSLVGQRVCTVSLHCRICKVTKG